MTVSEQLSVYAAMTEEMLHHLLDAVETSELLRESMAYSLFAGGKRLRPALCLAACELMEEDAQTALLPACALEMIHTYSLIHDDLPAMDNDTLRRGKPTNHVVYGEGNAILAGDGLLSLAFRSLSTLPNPNVAQAVAQGAFDMVSGQSYDTNLSDDPAMMDTIHRLKTGALIKAAVLAGAYCAAPSQREIYALSTFSEKFGLLFQVTDDILDVEGEAAALGKSIGKDAAEHKLTSVSRFGLDGAKTLARHTAEEAEEALQIFGDRARFFMGLTQKTLTRKA